MEEVSLVLNVAGEGLADLTPHNLQTPLVKGILPCDCGRLLQGAVGASRYVQLRRRQPVKRAAERSLLYQVGEDDSAGHQRYRQQHSQEQYSLQPPAGGDPAKRYQVCKLE